MSGTKSPFLKAQATDSRDVVLIAFGSISAPDPQDAALRSLASRVGEEMPGWRIRGATMAAKDSILRAFEGLGDEALVFPLLMADGWILRKVLRDALQAAGQGGARVLTPLGLLPGFHALCADLVRDGLRQSGLDREKTTVVLAAHGSARGPRPAVCARALCETLESATGVRQVVPGYLEEAPFLKDALAQAPKPAICLPCFVTNAYHATNDVPEAVAESGFVGPVLPAAGTVPEMVQLIADTLHAYGQDEKAA